VITTVSVAQAKQLWDVDELADDRKSSAAAAKGGRNLVPAFLAEQQGER
jgi:hypothetical protein